MRKKRHANADTIGRWRNTVDIVFHDHTGHGIVSNRTSDIEKNIQENVYNGIKGHKAERIVWPWRFRSFTKQARVETVLSSTCTDLFLLHLIYASYNILQNYPGKSRILNITGILKHIVRQNSENLFSSRLEIKWKQQQQNYSNEHRR